MSGLDAENVADYIKPNGHAEPSPPAVRGLVTKLCEVMSAVGYIQKRGTNQKHQYKYATEADIVDAIRGELASRKVFLFPDMLSSERKLLYKTQSGSDMYITDVVIKWTFVDGETGETRECTMPGCGTDMQDKGIYKAITGCEKYVLMKAFLLPTGDDPEKDEKEPRPSKEEFAAGKEAQKAVVDRKLGVSGHATDAAKFATSATAHAEKGAVALSRGEGAALKVVTFTDDTIMREWKGVPRAWQKIEGDGLGTLLTGMESADPHFKREFMWCNEGEYLWYVMKAKAEILAEAAVSMGLDAKRASVAAGTTLDTKSGGTAQAEPTKRQVATDDAKLLQYVRMVDKNVTAPFIVMRYGDTEHGCYEQSIWDYLERGSGKMAKLELSKPIKSKGKTYVNIIGIDQIGDRTYSDNKPDRYPSDLGPDTPTF